MGMMHSFEERLRAKYPLTYRVPVRCGLYVPEEWEPEIERLSGEIEAYLLQERIGDFVVAQVKEKFGGLRFYIDSHIPAIEEMILQSEHRISELERKRMEERK